MLIYLLFLCMLQGSHSKRLLWENATGKQDCCSPTQLWRSGRVPLSRENTRTPPILGSLVHLRWRDKVCKLFFPLVHSISKKMIDHGRRTVVRWSNKKSTKLSKLLIIIIRASNIITLVNFSCVLNNYLLEHFLPPLKLKYGMTLHSWEIKAIFSYGRSRGCLKQNVPEYRRTPYLAQN